MADSNDPGPDWWPTFSWWQAARWFSEGFLLPILITGAVFTVGFIGSFFLNGASLDDALAYGRFLVLAGILVSGGAVSLMVIIDGGLRWKTSLRLAGLLPGIIVLWTYIVPLLLD